MRELKHFGVKGMKWGVRRSAQQLRDSIQPSGDARTAAKIKTKAKIGGVKALSNQDIQKAIQRMQLERQYVEALGSDSLRGRAQKWLGDFLRDTAKDTFVSYFGGRRGPSGPSTPRRVPPIRAEVENRQRSIGS